MLPHHHCLIDSSNEACDCRARDCARRTHQTSIGLCDVQRVFISQRGEGSKKKTPVGDKQPWPAFEYSSIYRMSVLHVGDTQKRDGGTGVAVVNFSLAERKKEKGHRAHGIRVRLS